ncbi:DUF4446 family protein [Candidatus Chlorohelix sp.]|uniref:DUF4446 family protein n=1 Tax=Candidatus Chlorohelix sp. TaxID=3139201 RepID=UPI003049BCDF
MTGFESFFSSAGPYLWILTLLLLAGLGFMLWRVNKHANQMYRLLDNFVRDTRGGESGLEELINRIKRIERDASMLDVIQTAMRELELRQNRSYQSVGLVRFNPFTDMGGDQSFALAIIDSFGNGFVMSSLHGRTATRIYAKTVKRGQAVGTISSEEQASIDQAMRNQQLTPDFPPTSKAMLSAPEDN